MTTSPVATCVRSLTINGYVLDRAHSDYGYTILDFHRYDHFSVRIAYSFVLYESISPSTIKSIVKAATKRNASVVLIGAKRFPGVPCLTWEDFVGKMGGPVPSWTVVDPEFSRKLQDLAQNKLPPEMEGQPDTLFENMVKEALQFLFSDRVIQYGQERLFEKVPDGIAFVTHHWPILYDCKAYGKGYSVNADDVRRFADYVNEFNRRYATIYHSVQTFLVVTGELADSGQSLERRVVDLRAACNAQLVVVCAEDLGEIVTLLVGAPASRRSIDWKRLLASNKLVAKDVREELDRIARDQLLER